ncbi:hypothetical protein [Trichodesmium erythraeum]|nr:hypothetical protein [Trichodesmium erythraeum 21-75]
MAITKIILGQIKQPFVEKEKKEELISYRKIIQFVHQLLLESDVS